MTTTGARALPAAMSHPLPGTFLPRHDFDFPAEDPDSLGKFQTLVGPMFEVTRLNDAQPFHARSCVISMGDIMLACCTAAAARFERSRTGAAKSGIDDISIVVYRTGSFSFEIDGHRQVVHAGDIAFFDLALPYDIESAAVDNISLLVSRRRLTLLAPTLRHAHGLVLRDGISRHLLSAHLTACMAMGARINAAEASSISNVTLQLVAACWQAATTRQGLGAARHLGHASQAKIKDFIEHQLANTLLGPELLMQTFGVSRATLYRFFEPMGGVSAHITQRRLRRALQIITTPDSGQRIKQLARELGFLDASAFTRAFKKQFGMSPREARSQQHRPHALDASTEQAMQPRGAGNELR